MQSKCKCTPLWSSCTRTAARFSMANGTAPMPTRPERKTPEWNWVWGRPGRSTASQAPSIHGSHSIPVKRQCTHQTFVTFYFGWMCDLRDWKCCGIRWTCVEIDSMDSRSPWSNIPKGPCSWSCWTIHRTIRSSMENKMTSTKTRCRCMTQWLHSPGPLQTFETNNIH